MAVEHDQIERTRGRAIPGPVSWPISWPVSWPVSWTVLAIAAAALSAVLLAFGYADSERERELRQWQVRLGMIADTRAGAVEHWLRNQIDAVGAVAENASVELYMSRLTNLPEDATPASPDLARSGYLRNLLAVVADREGFAAPPVGPDVAANVRRIGVAGMALLDTDGRIVAATAGMPTIEGRLGDFVAGAEAGRAALLDIHRGAAGGPTMAFLAPVFAVQGDRTPAFQVGWALGVKEVGGELFALLHQPGAPWASAEALLVRRDGATVTYVSPTTGDRGALERRLAIDTPSLAATYGIEHPGGFSRARDYLDNPVLVTARTVTGSRWSLMYKIDVDEALGPSETRLAVVLAGIALAVMIAIAAVVAVWRHGASRRATAAASRYHALARRHEAQSRLLGLIGDCQPDPMFILDADGRYTYANRAAAEQAGISADDMLGKSVDSVLGPVPARRILDQNRRAEAHRTEFVEIREAASEDVRRIVQSAHIPVPESSDLESGVMVVERDITDIVAERDRGLGLRDKLIRTLLAIVDRRDPYAASHSAQVAAVARGIAEEMGLDAVSIETAATAGELMNVGKILVPPETLCSVDELESSELRSIRESVQATAGLFDDVAFDGPVVEVLRQVQERWDGAGAPEGLRGADILLPARVVAVANAFVAMISPRAWRPGMSIDDAIGRLMADIGGAFDRRVVAALVNRIDNRDGREIWSDRRSSAA